MVLGHDPAKFTPATSFPQGLDLSPLYGHLILIVANGFLRAFELLATLTVPLDIFLLHRDGILWKVSDILGTFDSKPLVHSVYAIPYP